MTEVRAAKLSDIKAAGGKQNLLGGPCYSFLALEMFLKAPEFTVQVYEGALMVLYHESMGGKSHMLLLTGVAGQELLAAGDEAARQIGTVKIALEVEPGSPALNTLERAGYHRKGDVANYFGKDRPAYFMEKLL